MNSMFIDSHKLDYKSVFHVGNNMHIYNDKHWNWWHKLWWKILLGISIENFEE